MAAAPVILIQSAKESPVLKPPSARLKSRLVLRQGMVS